MERITEIKPAYDKRALDPKKNYGIGAMRVFMVLKGELGAVHFIWSTGILLPETEKEYAKLGKLNWENLSNDPDREHWFSLMACMGHDVGTHSPKPQFEGHEVTRPTKMVKTGPKPLDITFENVGEIPNCEWIGVPCYCDGSAMLAEEYMDILRREGSDKIWELLEARYQADFGELK